MSINLSHSLVSTIPGPTADYFDVTQQDQGALMQGHEAFEEQETPRVTQPRSYAALTIIPINSNSKSALNDLPDLITENLIEVFRKRKWDGIIGDNTTISVKAAVRIEQISEREDIFNLSGDFPIQRVPIIDKLNELRELHKLLLSQKKVVACSPLGQLFNLLDKNQQHSVTFKRAIELNSLYKKYMKQTLFDFDSIRSKAIQEAKKQIEKEGTNSRLSSTSQKRPRHELISLKGDQPQRKKRRTNNTAKTKIDLSPVQDDQQQHLTAEAYPEVLPIKGSFKIQEISDAKQSSSLAELTKINIAQFKTEIRELHEDSDKRKEFKDAFGKDKWNGIVRNTSSLSIYDSVRLNLISKRKIIQFNEDLLIEIACATSQDNIAKAKSKDRETRREINRIKRRQPQWIGIEKANRINALSNPKPVFDLKSILSKAIEEAENQLKEMQIGTGSLQQQNNQAEENNALLSQEEQYYDYQESLYNTALIEEQNNQNQQYDAFPSQENYPEQFYSPDEEYNFRHLHQEQISSFQQQIEQNNVAPSQQIQYPQYDDYQTEQPETVSPTVSSQDQGKQPEQLNDDQIYELFGNSDESWIGNL